MDDERDIDEIDEIDENDQNAIKPKKKEKGMSDTTYGMMIAFFVILAILIIYFLFSFASGMEPNSNNRVVALAPLGVRTQRAQRNVNINQRIRNQAGRI